MKIFCGFQNFEHILWQKHENPEPEINKKKKKSKAQQTQILENC